MAKFAVVYDACVLYPAPLRDLLVRLAKTDLFRAHWTEAIHQEWIHAVLREKRHSLEKLERVKELMNNNVREALITDYEHLIDLLELPDPNDRHVLAAAIHCRADAIVTFNLRDFPERLLKPYKIEIIHPDDFVCYQLDLSMQRVFQVIRKQRTDLNNPPKTAAEMLITFQKQQLPKTCLRLQQYLDFL